MYLNIKRPKRFSYILAYRGTGHRKTALKKVLQWLETNQNYNFEIILVEQDVATRIDFKLPKNCKHIFVYNATLFNKSWAFNIAARASSTEVLVFADCDVIMNFDELFQCVLACNNYDAVDPKRELLDLQENEEPGSKKCSPRLGIDFCVAICLIKKSCLSYMNNWCEDFEGWGGEDNAMTHKVLTMLDKTKKFDFIVYHLFHTSEGHDKNTSQKNWDILNKIKSMDKEQLLNFCKNSNVGDNLKYLRK